jgi:hemin uptake protein HemP
MKDTLKDRFTEISAENQEVGGVLRYSAEKLFGDSPEILIENGSATYRLRRTSLGKLILTK